MAANTGASWRSGQLRLLLLNEPFTGVGDASGLLASAVAGNLHLALHHTAVGVGGSQTTNEASYPGYTRKAIPRTALGFSEASGVGANVATLDFPKATGVEPGGAGKLPYWSLGTDPTGAGKVLFQGQATGALVDTLIIAGIIPRIEAGELTLTVT